MISLFVSLKSNKSVWVIFYFYETWSLVAIPTYILIPDNVYLVYYDSVLLSINHLRANTRLQSAFHFMSKILLITPCNKKNKKELNYIYFFDVLWSPDYKHWRNFKFYGTFFLYFYYFWKDCSTDFIITCPEKAVQDLEAINKYTASQPLYFQELLPYYTAVR